MTTHRDVSLENSVSADPRFLTKPALARHPRIVFNHRLVFDTDLVAHDCATKDGRVL